MRAGFLAHGSAVIRPLSWAPYWACDLHFHASPSPGHPYIALGRAHGFCSVPHPDHRHTTVPTSAYPRAFLAAGASWGIPPRVVSGGHLLTGAACTREHNTGFLRAQSPCVAEGRTPRFAGFRGGVSGAIAEPPSPYPCLLAQADHPPRLVPPPDESTMDSCACPYSARRDGSLSRILSDRLLAPLGGLMVSRSRRGYAVPATPEGQEWHLHGD